jgi:hypothetical protein
VAARGVGVALVARGHGGPLMARHLLNDVPPVRDAVAPCSRFHTRLLRINNLCTPRRRRSLCGKGEIIEPARRMVGLCYTGVNKIGLLYSIFRLYGCYHMCMCSAKQSWDPIAESIGTIRNVPIRTQSQIVELFELLGAAGRAICLLRLHLGLCARDPFSWLGRWL